MMSLVVEIGRRQFERDCELGEFLCPCRGTDGFAFLSTVEHGSTVATFW